MALTLSLSGNLLYFSKLALFQKPGIKFFRPCPLSRKDSPPVDYKNIKLLRKYLSESGRILPSRITSVSQKKQKKNLKKKIKFDLNDANECEWFSSSLCRFFAMRHRYSSKRNETKKRKKKKNNPIRC